MQPGVSSLSTSNDLPFRPDCKRAGVLKIVYVVREVAVGCGLSKVCVVVGGNGKEKGKGGGIGVGYGVVLLFGGLFISRAGQSVRK